MRTHAGLLPGSLVRHAAHDLTSDEALAVWTDALRGGSTLAIPCDTTLIGANLWTQWLLPLPSTCPILPDYSLTNALRFSIGE